jgi:hypothetical protein
MASVLYFKNVKVLFYLEVVKRFGHHLEAGVPPEGGMRSRRLVVGPAFFVAIQRDR